MGLPENIDALLVKHDITPDEFATTLDFSPSTVSRWRHGGDIRKSSVLKICEHFGLIEDDLLSDSVGLAAKEHGIIPKNAIMPNESREAYAPLLGRVHAGNATEPEVLEDRISLPAEVADAHPHAYFLQVEGNCMNEVYPEGCYVLVDPDKTPSNGSIAAVMIDGVDAVMRRLYRTPNTMVLSAESYSESYDDIIITADSDHTVELVGTVVWFQASKEME